MFRIRYVSGSTLPIDRSAIDQVQQILREQFPGLQSHEVSSLHEKLRNPIKYRYRSILLVAENGRGTIQGFALLSYEPKLHFCFLDYLSSSSLLTSRGIGGALYERVRTEAQFLKARGLYYECLPDDPALCRDGAGLKQNEKRLRFYERYDARPIINTRWETPFETGDDCPPYLVFDPLGSNAPPSLEDGKAIFSAILELKYGKRCPAGYIDTIIGSITDNPLRIRPARYQPRIIPQPAAPAIPPDHRSFGGFCYFNNASIAANMLSKEGKVALLDIDYHHGNGHQDIFYRRADVLTVSIHGHPHFAYPYFSGFKEEQGEGDGKGFNVNYPLAEAYDGVMYRSYLSQALHRIAQYKPAFLVISLGLDTANGDPTGSWSLAANDFELNGTLIGALRLPTLVVQEGGYSTQVLGVNARRFLTGLQRAIVQG